MSIHYHNDMVSPEMLLHFYLHVIKDGAVLAIPPKVRRHECRVTVYSQSVPLSTLNPFRSDSELF